MLTRRGIRQKRKNRHLKCMLRHPTRRTSTQTSVADHTATVSNTAAFFVFDLNEKGLACGKIPREHVGNVALSQGSS